jgi:DNA-binding winged helix-turn-helix (wHTH) protein/tetratricopeptide (TPR) repeat protein/nucleoside-triphosphatase THEP1
MSLPPRELYEFGPYRVDVGLSRLERAGTIIPVRPKAFDLLLLLARNPERVHSKSELMEALWPNAFVEEANLTQHIYTLRKALGDRPDGAPYIATVPRRGYRLNADVREAHGAPRVLSERQASTPVAATPEPRVVPPVTVDSERKQATVLHLGVANAAILAEQLGPEGLDEAVARLADVAGEAIGRYEGILRQPQADEFVALFGARVVHEDDARRALLAALAIQQRLRQTFGRGTPSTQPCIRIGIASGTVVVSRRADDRGIEYSALGDTMRIAGLLQQTAEPDSILISEATHRAVERYVRVDSVPIDVRAAGSAAFRVVGLAPEASMRAPRPKRVLSEFVGRRHEAALLRDLSALALDGRGQVVNIVGEPGMGKSRLVHEFIQALSTEGRHTILEGRCVSYGSLVPYLPVTDLIRAYFGVSETDTPDDIRQLVARSAQELDLPADAGAYLLRLIGGVDSTMAPETRSPEAVKAWTFEVLRTLFLKASERKALVIVVEDVHWIDRTSEEFLTTLIERLMAARVMVVTTYRPGYRAPWMDRSYVTQTTLVALATADSARLVESVDVAHRMSADVAAAILSKAEGNPFFLEELARTVIEDGSDGQVIPNTVHGVIMARLDRLPDKAKRLLQTAAVLGRQVPLGLLRRVWRGTDFENELAEVSRLEFLYERPGGDETVYVFKHALTQDVAYDSLLARNRRDLHVDAARALHELSADRLDEIAATLAYHYARTDLVDEAVAWLIRAADQAARVYANAEAILHLDLARRRLERLPEGLVRDRLAVDVALREAYSFYFLGQFNQSVDVLQPHASRLARLNDPALTAAFAFWLAHMYSRLGDQRRAAEWAHRAIAAAVHAQDEATLGKAHGVLALEGHWSGATKEGIAHGEKAIHLLRGKTDQRWWLGMAYFYVAMNHVLAGNFDAALAEARHADAVGKEIGDPRLQTYAGFMVGWVEGSRGNYQVALAACRRSVEQAPDRVSHAFASMVLSFTLLEAGDHAAARALLEPIVAEFELFGFPQWHAWASILIGETYRLDGIVDTAAGYVARGLDMATQTRYWYAVGFGERVAARIARDRGRLGDSAEAVDRALQTFQRIGAAFEATRTQSEAKILTSAEN